MSAVGKVPSPDLVKSPDARSPGKAKSPVAARSKGVRRSWGFAMAARLAASLRQSLEGEPVARKPQTQSPTAASSGHESKPAAEDAVHDSINAAEAHHNLDAPSASPVDQEESADLAEDPFSPMFSPLSSGLDQMQTGSAFAEREAEDDSSRASHADDLQLLQKQAGLHGVEDSAPPPAEADAAVTSSSETSLVPSKLMDPASQPLLTSPASRTSPDVGASDVVNRANTASDLTQAAPTVSSSDTPCLSPKAARNSSDAATSGTDDRRQSSLVDAATNTDEDAAMASTPMRLVATSRSGNKAQPVTSPADAQEDGDPPESPSPLRDGLAFMTPLSAFDGTPEPGLAASAEDGHTDSPSTQTMAAQLRVPFMQALDDSQDNVTEDPGSSAAAVRHADAGLSNGPASARQAVKEAASHEGHAEQPISSASTAVEGGDIPVSNSAQQQDGQPAAAAASSGTSKPSCQQDTHLGPVTKQPLPAHPSEPQHDQMSLPAGLRALCLLHFDCLRLLNSCLQLMP